jgi:hypothetical protein
MPITLDNADSNRYSAVASSLTYSFTRASGSGVLFVSCVATSDNSITGVTYGGQSMTLMASQSMGSGATLYLWRLRNPVLSGAQNVVVSASGSSTILATSISFSGDTHDAVNANAAQANALTLANSLSVQDQSWCVLAAGGLGYNVTAGTGTTATTSLNPLTGRNGPRSGAGTTSMSVNTVGGDTISSIICEVREGVVISEPTNSFFFEGDF